MRTFCWVKGDGIAISGLWTRNKESHFVDVECALSDVDNLRRKLVFVS